MSRDDMGRYRQRRSPAFIGLTWIGSFLSLGLLYLTGIAVKGIFASMRSCDVNSSGLSVVNCGKEGFALTDFLMIGLFILTATLVVTLFTGAWRMTRRSR